MAKQKMEIRTRAYVRVEQEWQDVDTLSAEQRRELATKIKKAYLDELYISRGVRFEEAGT